MPSIHRLKPDLPATLDPVFERALAKEPSARYPSAAEFVAELRAALRDDAGTTSWIVPTPPLQTAITRVAASATTVAYAPPAARRSPARRSRWLLLPLLFLLLIGGGIAAAVASTRGGSPPAHAARRPVTIMRTVMQPGTTIEQTVTAPAPPPATVTAPSPPPATRTPAATMSGAALNAEGYTKMKAGDYQGALPLLQQAVRQLSGASTLDEAYADYNLAYTQYELGSCTDVLSLLHHSQAIQGRRTEIDALRRDAQKACR